VDHIGSCETQAKSHLPVLRRREKQVRRAGDVGYVPFAMGHYIENVGDTPMRFLEIFKSSYFADVSLDQWMALTPRELVEAHLKLDHQVMDGLRKDKAPVVPA
jgi:oxalate decarboxylase